MMTLAAVHLSGNLDRVEECPSEPPSDSIREFQLWTAPDCAGTQYENGNRSWFYFSIVTIPSTSAVVASGTGQTIRLVGSVSMLCVLL